MKTISQIAKLSGISVRTLQYYDEIGLLKPSSLSESGYRLYDEEALGKLQQILTLKELDFSLKEVQQLLSGAKSDRAAAFCRKKHQFLIERGHLDRQIELLTRLEDRDTIDNLQEYDLSEYFRALEEFKTSHKDEVITYWGSEENFDLFIRQIRKSEAQAARLAVQEFGSIEAYTVAMKYNLEHFSEIMEKWQTQIPEELKAEDPFVKLASHKGEPVSSDAVQQLVRDAISRARGTAASDLFCDHASYCDLIIELYSGDYIQAVTDTKHGTGSAEYIVSAFQYYLEHFRDEEEKMPENEE